MVDNYSAAERAKQYAIAMGSAVSSMDIGDLSESPLNLLNAAKRSEVQAALDALESKINEIIARLDPQE